MSHAMLFGKLPAHGDFVARGLAAAERDALDDWLAGSLAGARVALGEAFEPAYDGAPPWRFAAAGDDGWSAGAIAPSVDGVGRRYPVMVALGALPGDRVETAAEVLEDLLYTALGEGWDADRLAGAVAAADIGATSPWTYGDRWWTLGGGAEGAVEYLPAVVAGARPPGLVGAMLRMREGNA